jgi:glyoxylase-like metal-dependent hydrolase (beta-lactamase superfamily II)
MPITSFRPSLNSPSDSHPLPAGLRVFERGWLSANGILFQGGDGTALVDSGYWAHSPQTVALVRGALGGQPLDLLLNTHLHSDHCGGNSALQKQYPLLKTLIPPGLAAFVRDWDPVALSYTPTGQECPRFHFDGLLSPGQEIVLGEGRWQVHSTPGHDPHSIVLFEPITRTLISADALWENGFGIVFEELEGFKAFDEVSSTLDLIESLAPEVVIPGHGGVFANVGDALAAARSRLESFVDHPARHAKHAAKVLLKFKLLEVQRALFVDFKKWAVATQYFNMVHQRFPSGSTVGDWVELLTSELVRSGAARREGEMILNA